MKGLTRTMGRQVGILGVAFALAVGSVGLAGCGGSGDASSGSGTEAAGSDEEAAEIELQQWFETLNETQQESESTSWVNPDETFMATNDNTTTYELDESGNIIKKTETSANKGQGYEFQSEVVSEYTFDEKGWPLTIDVTTTDKQYSASYEAADGYDEDGNPLGGWKQIEDGESIDTAEPTTETKTVTFTYEHDDKGRVTKVESDDLAYGTFELTYHDNGRVASYKRTNAYQSYDSEGNERTDTYTIESTFDDKGVTTGYRQVSDDADGIHDTSGTMDEKGRILSETTTTTDADGTTHKATKTYDIEKDKDGNAVKTTCTVSGDGEGSTERWVNSDLILSETFGKDGSITVAEVTHDENYNDIVGEETTYDGPYSVEECTYDDDGHALTSTITYYDGATETTENTYDEDGNLVKSVIVNIEGVTTTIECTYDADGNQLTSNQVTDGEGRNGTMSRKMEWVFVEKPSEYAGLYRQYTSW